MKNENIKKGYKKTAVGVIPEEWEMKRLEDICSHFKSGNGITSKDIKEDDKYSVYGGNGLRGFTDSYTHEGNYFLIGRQGALCGNIQRVKGKVFISEHAIAVQTNKNNNLDFLAYKLEHFNLNRLSESSAQPGLAVNKLVRLRLPIPPLPEQQAIAHCLTTWDSGIEKLTALINAKKEQKKGLMQQLLTGKKRLDGFEGEWEEVKLGELCNITTGKLNANAMVENGEYRFYTCAKEYFFIDHYAFDTEALLISGNGANVGYIHYYKGKFNAYQRTYVLDSFNQNITYIKYYLDQKLEHRIAMEKHEGNTPYIILSTLEQMKIKLPSTEEQTAIAHILTTADKEISLLKKKLAAMKEEKKGLMQVLLTGEKRLIDN